MYVIDCREKGLPRYPSRVTYDSLNGYAIHVCRAQESAKPVLYRVNILISRPVNSYV